MSTKSPLLPALCRLAGLTALGAILAAPLAVPEPASAQVQSSAAARCISDASKAASRMSKAVFGDADLCVGLALSGSVPSGLGAAECLRADIRGRIERTREKLDDVVAEYCDLSPPDFGFSDGTTFGDVHIEEAALAGEDAYGADLDQVLVDNAATDPNGRCLTTFVSGSSKIHDAMQKSYTKCLKEGLKKFTVTSVEDAGDCAELAHALIDKKAGKQVDRLRKKLLSKCATGDLATLMPGLATTCARHATATDAAGTAQCMGLRVHCRLCRAWVDANALEEDCDLLDDATDNDSCPACADGILNAGEECDDGNLVDGDGCTRDCIIEFCGDGVINNSGTEECDDGDTNSDTEANACRTDCTLPGCGDGVIDSGETCDDGMETATCDIDCTDVSCGDGLANTTAGEECDDANASNNDACLNDCTDAACGDGFVFTGTEDCDDGNTAGGDCCAAACLYESNGSPCDGPSAECTVAACDGAGACIPTPTNEGGACDDGQLCTVAASCSAGTCTADTQASSGEACHFAVVAAGTGVTALTGNRASSTGAWCAPEGSFSNESVFSGDIVATSSDGGNIGITFGADVVADTADIVSNAAIVRATGSNDLPGLSNISQLAPGQTVAKDPAPTVYDTTGSDPRLGQCTTAQADLAAFASALDGLPSDGDFAGAYAGLAAGSSPAAIVAANPGAVSVFDFDDITGGNNVTLTLDGGGNAASVLVLRVAGRIVSGNFWTVSLQGGLTADRVVFYAKSAASSVHCSWGRGTVGAGTVVCPNTKVELARESSWSGQLLGGAGGASGRVETGNDASLTYLPFRGL